MKRQAITRVMAASALMAVACWGGLSIGAHAVESGGSRPPSKEPSGATAATLARDHGCMSCHGLVRKQVGPGFAQIAERYRGDASASARLEGKIHNGSVGTWGRVIMPRQPGVSEQDAGALAQWVLSQPSPPPR